MDGCFIAFIVTGAIWLVIGVPALLLTGGTSQGRLGGRVIFTALLLLAGLFLFLSGFKIVGAKDIGVPVTFGRPSGNVLHNGWNWKNPATAVHVFDGSLQTEQYSTDKDDAGPPVQVRLFTGSVASVNVTFQWRLADDNSVRTVYSNYRQPENINRYLVKRALQQALNMAFESYNPYSALIAAQEAPSGNTPGTQQVAVSYSSLQNAALEDLRGELSRQGVQAVSLTIASISYDGNTQHELDALGTAIAQTQVAIQGEKTAAAQAAANTTLNNSKATNTTLQQLCIQATEKVLEEGHSMPPGWNCFGASAATITAGR